jgi:hypothetical protein
LRDSKVAYDFLEKVPIKWPQARYFPADIPVLFVQPDAECLFTAA